ncbi:MAG: adenylate/guanylate cyclase domain-containing protein [Polyangiaceae bacterium]
MESLFDWLLDGIPGVKTPLDIADRVAGDLVLAGVPLERLGIFVDTLHPNVAGRAFIWERGQPTRMATQSLATRRSSDYADSPIAWCAKNAQELRWKKDEPDRGYQAIREFEARGCVDYICFPLRFSNGEVHVLSASSNAGFSDENVGALRHIARPLARIAEAYAMRRVTDNILAAYVGPQTGARVIAGHIFKGDVETIHAAIWFSDLRGFTEMSGKTPAKEMIAVLNDVFECQVPAIEKHGGEVLKFIGDGLLAIFPFEAGAPAASHCTSALAAAKEALAAIDAMNARASTALRIGLALHVGDVEYGNIGGASRLDFTAIGAAINNAARLEGIASKVGRALVLSQEFAEAVGGEFEDLGDFELKGIAGARKVFAGI